MLSGESAFHSLMTGFAWAKDPMFPRLSSLDPDVPVTALYGGTSWVGTISQEAFEGVRDNKGCYTRITSIPDAGHHVYSDQSVAFNKEVIRACKWSDVKSKK
jgi:pimeloyl-ACP methyl ester carboxylesterase